MVTKGSDKEDNDGEERGQTPSVGIYGSQLKLYLSSYFLLLSFLFVLFLFFFLWGYQRDTIYSNHYGCSVAVFQV